MRKAWVILIFLVFSSCNNTELVDCDCSKIKIYGHPICGMFTPIAISKEAIKEDDFIILNDINYIDSIINEIMYLEEFTNIGDVDNRFFLEIECKGSRNIEVQSNCNRLMYNDSYFKPSNDLIKLIKEVVKKNKK